MRARAALVATLPVLLVLGSAATSQAATPSAPPFGQCPAVNLSPSCEILLQVNADGSVTVLRDPGVGPYDGGDDTLVGIVNQSGVTVDAVTVNGNGTGLGQFDGDGLCAYLGCANGPTGYEGPGTSFVTASSQPDAAEVDFTGGLAPAATAYFSLENDLQFAQLTARKGHLAGNVNYVALGDSYSSGEGNPPFLPGTDIPGDYCHRSSQAYSQVLGASLGAAPVFYACSGAVADNVTRTVQYPGEGAFQLARPGVDASASLLTMTIGGNDAGFSSVLQTCIGQKLKADLKNATIGPVGRWLGMTSDPSCAHSSTFVTSTNSQVDTAGRAAQDAYQQVAGKVDPVNTSIIVADYPKLFPTSQAEQSCVQLAPFLSGDDQKFMNAAGDRLDDALNVAAAHAGVNFVDVRSQFAGHAVCGNSGAYINGLSIASGNAGSCIWAVLGKCVIPGLPIVGSFHPNASGHADGYASAFQAAINAAVTRTPQGFPANPGPSFGPHTRLATTGTSSTPTAGPAPVGVATLTAFPVSGGPSSCEGTVQAGQLLQVSGSGFTAGAAVQVFVSSAGLGASSEQQVGQVTADSNGVIATTIRIPLAAHGFTQAGSGAGLISVDAIGPGAAASHLDDLTMLGVAPHGSACGAVDTLPFQGFLAPVQNAPAVNTVQPGSAEPVKFTLPGAPAALSDVLADGYPRSTPVSCTSLAATGGPTATVAVGTGSPAVTEQETYVWKTDRSWTGCRLLEVRLVDGSNHTAVFNFGS